MTAEVTASQPAGGVGMQPMSSRSPSSRGRGKLTVRAAERDDVQTAVDLTVKSLREGVFRALPLDEDRMGKFAQKCLSKPDQHTILLAERQGPGGRTVAEGILVGSVDRMLFSPARMGIVSLVFVERSARGGWAAIRLLRTFQTWAEQRDAFACTIHVTSGVSYNRTHRFLEKAGWKLVGGNYIA